jgi:hypothetical protein
MSEILFALALAAFSLALLGLAIYEAGVAEGRRRHRAESRRAPEASLKPLAGADNVVSFGPKGGRK